MALTMIITLRYDKDIIFSAQAVTARAFTVTTIHDLFVFFYIHSFYL